MPRLSSRGSLLYRSVDIEVSHFTHFPDHAHHVILISIQSPANTELMKLSVEKFKRYLPSFGLGRFFGKFSHDVGIDLGTANTLVWVKDKGIVIREPSVVARHRKSKEVLAIGESTKKMLGRAPGTLEIIRPLKDGVIADFDATAAMLDYYVKKVHESGGVIPKIPRPRIA